MLGSTSIYPEKNTASLMTSSPITSPQVPPIEPLPLNLSMESDKPDTRKFRTSTVSVSASSPVHRADISLDTLKSPDNTSVQAFSTPVVVPSFSADWSKLNKDESRNLLICVLFVLKHLDKG